MRTPVKYALTIMAFLTACVAMYGQADRREVRSGNRQFKKGDWQKSEIEYRKALLKDTSSVAASWTTTGRRPSVFLTKDAQGKTACRSFTGIPDWVQFILIL